MGKKRKRSNSGGSNANKTLASASSSSSNRPGSPPPPDPIHLRWEEIPLNNMRTFLLTKELDSLKREYCMLIEWVRTMMTLQGTVLEGIRTANCVEGCRVMVLEITYRSTTVKLLVTKGDLYAVGYWLKGCWYMLAKSPIRLEGANELKDTQQYTSSPWNEVGPGMLKLAFSHFKKDNLALIKHGFEILVFHFLEAARFHKIMSLVYNSIHPRKSGSVDFTYKELTEPNVKILVKNWANLSKLWVVYALADKKLQLSKPFLSKYGITGPASIKDILAVVSKVSISKIKKDKTLTQGLPAATKSALIAELDRLQEGNVLL